MKTIIKASIVGALAGVAAFAVCNIIQRRNEDFIDFEEDFDDEVNPIEIIDLDIDKED